jgi:hypothetical protein
MTDMLACHKSSHGNRMSKRSLQIATGVLGSIPVVAGVIGMAGLSDPIYVSAGLPANALLDSNLRFFSGVWLGLGLALYWLIPKIEKQTVLFHVIWLASRSLKSELLVYDCLSHANTGSSAASHSTGPSVAMRLFQSRRRSGQAATVSFVTRFDRAMYSSWRSRTAPVSAELWNRMLFS